MTWTVDKLMTPRDSIVVAHPDTPFKLLVELMHMKDVSGLPVVDSADRVLGVVSEADLLLKEELHPPIEQHEHRPRPAAGDARRAEAATALTLMTSPAVTVGPEDSAVRAARLMHEEGVKRLPVVDGGGRLVGMISRRDLLTLFLRTDADIEEEVRADLKYYLWLGPEQVQAAVWRGVVTLEGRVESRSLADLAGRLCAGVAGVVGVVNELSFTLDDRHLGAAPPPLAEKLAASERSGL